MIDTHSHILPGIDDGSRDIAESIAMVQKLVSQGVTDIIATPHYMDGTTFVSPRKKNLKLLEELKQALVDEGVKVNLYLGNEIFIDEKIPKLVKASKISPMADSKYLLVELPLDDEFPNYEGYLQDLINCGFKVVLAHPERYTIIQENYEIVKNLSKMGVLMQCNVGSFVGRYGKQAKKTIKRMAKDKLIFMLGSDIHRCGRHDYIAMAQKKLTKYYSEHELRWIMTGNAKKIIGKKK